MRQKVFIRKGGSRIVSIEDQEKAKAEEKKDATKKPKPKAKPKG